MATVGLFSGAPPEDITSFASVPFIHLASVAGYDYLEKPFNVIGTLYESRWDEVIKTGRYGEGKCARIDATFHIEDADIDDGFNVCEQGPWCFISGHTLVNWSSNMGIEYESTPVPPNGYNCVLPRTQRVHVYQKSGSAWVINAFNNVYTDGSTDYFIALKDGELRKYETYADLTSDIYTVLATVPDTTNQWYSLEIRQDPDTPLVLLPEEDWVTVPPGDPLVRVPITWRFLINGVEYHSEYCFSTGFELRSTLGFCKAIGTTDVFLDNYYTVFMTDVGVPTLANDTWIIRSGKPVHDTCRGQWVAYDNAINLATIEADYSQYIEFTNNRGIINHTMYTVSEVDPPYTCLDGNYTKFNYDIAVPEGAIATWTFATTLERYASVDYYRGVWVMDGNHPGWSQRAANGIGTIKDAFVSPLDPYWRIGMLLNTAAKRQEVYYKYLPVAKSAGSINVGTEYKGAYFP